MAKNSNITLSGRNIYVDKRGRIIYYDLLTKKGYYVGKEDENKLFFYKNRLVFILFAVILTIGTFFTTIQAALAGAITLVLVEAYYRFSFFKKLKVATHFERKNRISPIQAIIKEKTPVRTLILAFLYLAFAILIVINAYIEEYSIGINLVSIGLSIVGIYFFILHMIALSKMKKLK